MIIFSPTIKIVGYDFGFSNGMISAIYNKHDGINLSLASFLATIKFLMAGRSTNIFFVLFPGSLF